MMDKTQTPDKTTMTTQIISSNMLGSFLGYMPNPDDIVSGTFESYDTYRKMLADPRIKSLINKKKTSSLIFPVGFVQGKSSDEVYNFIKDIDLFKNLYRKEKRMLSSLNYGFSVSEVVWQNPSKNGGHWVPENIITRKPERFFFDTDWKLYCIQSGTKQLLDQNYKFLQMQHDPDDENPYGTSELRSVYWPWMFKKAGYEFWLQATEKFSVSSLVALFKTEGDDEKVKSRARMIAEMLLGVTSGSASALANVDDVKEINMAGKLSDFTALVDACDVQISYGLTGQSIATSKTDGGSLALGEVQADMLYEDCKGIALEIQSVVQKLINWCVELNFGPGVEAPQYMFDVLKKATFDQIMQAIDRGVPVSKSWFYDNYGVQAPNGDDDVLVKEKAQTEMALSDTYGTKKKAQNRKALIFSL